MSENEEKTTYFTADELMIFIIGILAGFGFAIYL